ncbi:MAG TPA: ABC transporter ATP-binding protein, partial [Candidatus Sumerlaeota bacterium]|nr:ABC transporter ATP-binding protein [Candidatus Sumerlaeota bacterium]
MARKADSPILEVRGLQAGYGDVTILSDINFSLRTGEILVILGTSGCGKSTLLKNVTRLVNPMA